jgi:predicted amidohydrolase YtcJ
MEQEKGSLEVSKLADLAVLSQDIFTVAPEQ